MNGSLPLDRFAPAYVPNWQRLPPPPGQEQPIHLPPFIPISPYHYSSELYPKPLLDYLESADAENTRVCAEKWVATIQAAPRTPAGESPKSRSRALPALSPSTYVTRSTLLQDSEYHARRAALRSSGLYNVTLTPIEPQPLPSGAPAALFSLSAPHIRENYPPVSMNDTVWLRQLQPWSLTLQPYVFEARVYSIQRVQGTVTLQCDALAAEGMWESGLFNVEWVPQERQFTTCRKALEFLHHDIAEAESSSPELRPLPARWLFPESHDNNESTVTTPSETDIRWIDSELNDEQKLAVESIVHGKHSIPYLISGPPGTGKTKTIVEAVFQILESHPGTHVLVCGASNSSADTLASRLSQRLKPEVLFRLNDPSRPMQEVVTALHPWCWSENGVWMLPPMKALLSKRVIVTSCVDASLLTSLRCSNAALAILEDLIASHLRAPESLPFPTRLHFGFLLVDEAAQASEMELCVPLAVVAPAPPFTALLPLAKPTLTLPHVTICGDVKQLGPRIESAECRSHDMDVSLLERLFERDVYKQSPFTRTAIHAQRRWLGYPPAKKQPLSTPFCNLTKSYRSHPAILMVPSTLFYQDTLVAFAPLQVQNTPLSNWPTLQTRDFPFLFRGTSSEEEWTDQRLSFFNTGEIREIMAMVSGLLGFTSPGAPYHLPDEYRAGLAPNEISIISPFREQVWKIRTALREVGLGAVDVGDVESLQGKENRVVIVSTVRSSSRFLAEDQRLNRGVIYEAKRFNVALTRAKELLVIVGNAETLKVDPWWKQLLKFALRNNAYQGPPIQSIDHSSADAFSRLEEEWNNRHHGVHSSYSPGVNGSNGHAHALDDQGFVIAGSIVREALREEDD